VSRTLLYSLLPLLGGAFIAVQAPVNARLRLVLGSPVGSTVVSFAIGTVVGLVVLAVIGELGTTTGALGGGPWWAYLGGLLGLVFVFATLLAAPQVGVTVTFVAVIVGQVAAAAAIDRFGLLGIPARPIDAERVLALALMAGALLLLLRGAR
jgi:bacterial/archaeal transporter family-2 protein